MEKVNLIKCLKAIKKKKVSLLVVERPLAVALKYSQ